MASLLATAGPMPRVMVVGRDVERGRKAAAEIRAAGGEADFISFDLRDAESAGELASRRALPVTC